MERNCKNLEKEKKSLELPQCFRSRIEKYSHTSFILSLYATTHHHAHIPLPDSIMYDFSCEQYEQFIWNNSFWKWKYCDHDRRSDLWQWQSHDRILRRLSVSSLYPIFSHSPSHPRRIRSLREAHDHLQAVSSHQYPQECLSRLHSGSLCGRTGSIYAV